ncbi:MAG: hypothetical protein ACHQ9S_23895 [Candidatus Binatia bacterium]
MTPEAALIELLARAGAAQGGAVLVSGEELSRWPAAAVAAMKSQKLLTKARPAASVVCPGCERECVMPVHTVPVGPRGPSTFIVCDKRSDINRVPVSAEGQKQWRCNADAVCGFVARSLGLRRSDQHPADAGLLNIGIARGDKRSQMLGLRADGDLALVVANNATPLAELVGYRDGEYSVDGAMVRQLVDSATTADPRYTPSNARREARKLDTQATYERWQKAYRDLKRRRRNMSDVWYAQQIAKQNIAARRSADTIRKHMKK